MSRASRRRRKMRHAARPSVPDSAPAPAPVWHELVPGDTVEPGDEFILRCYTDLNDKGGTYARLPLRPLQDSQPWVPANDVTQCGAIRVGAVLTDESIYTQFVVRRKGPRRPPAPYRILNDGERLQEGDGFLLARLVTDNPVRDMEPWAGVRHGGGWKPGDTIGPTDTDTYVFRRPVGHITATLSLHEPVVYTYFTWHDINDGGFVFDKDDEILRPDGTWVSVNSVTWPDFSHQEARFRRPGNAPGFTAPAVMAPADAHAIPGGTLVPLTVTVE